MARVEQGPHIEPTGPQEKCGVTAVLGKQNQDVAQIVPVYQDMLVNRGRDASGIAVLNKPQQDVVVYKGPGRALDVFRDINFSSLGLEGSAAIGHNRYATSGEGEKDSPEGMQPIEASYNGRSIAIAYNGNLPSMMRERLKQKIPSDMPDTPADIDTYDIARAIISSPGEEWEDKFKNALHDIPLAYSLTMLTDDGRVFGLRCPAGTWPLWYTEHEQKIIFASESRVVKDTDTSWQRVKPGELVEATPDGVVKTQLLPGLDERREQRCALNDLYGARKDSLFVEDKTYEDFRREVGRKLAEEHPIESDLIIGVPETGLAIAAGYAQGLGKVATEYIRKRGSLTSESKEDDGSMKAFIAADKQAMLQMIDGKYEIPNSSLSDLDLLSKQSAVLIDDTMIRGRTMEGDPTINAQGIIKRLKASGVEQIDLLLAASKFKEGCDQGYYIKKDQLIAYIKDEDGQMRELSDTEIALRLGVRSVRYISIDGLKDVYEDMTGDRECTCMACMGEPHPLDMIQSDTQPLPFYEPNTVIKRREINKELAIAD